MRRIILFRFHKNLLVCKNRLGLLKKFNPTTSIFGLYGGPEEYYTKFKEKLGPYLEDVYCIKRKSNFWKWKNGDLAVRLWYKDVGKKLSFDMLHIIEWDLVLFDSLDNLYKHIDKKGLGFTSLIPLKNIEKKWRWLLEDRYKEELNALLNFTKRKFDYNKKPYVFEGPGLCLPKKFLEKYYSIDIPELCHDELRLPLFAQIFGFKLYNTYFSKEWFSMKDKKFFNCDNECINSNIIKQELAKPFGRKVFHPYRKVAVLSLADYLLEIFIVITETVSSLRRNWDVLEGKAGLFLKKRYPLAYKKVKRIKEKLRHIGKTLRIIKRMFKTSKKI